MPAVTALLAASAALADARTAFEARCGAVTESVVQATTGEDLAAACGGFLNGAETRPRRTADVTAVLFTTRVWPEASFQALLRADTYAAPGHYELTVGQVRLRAHPTAEGDRVSASVEVTNLSSCVLLLDLRFLDGGSYVTEPWQMRVRSRRSTLSARPVNVHLPDVTLRTPLAARTGTDEFSAEFTARFVDCGRGGGTRFL